jgi:hypothetical protein
MFGSCATSWVRPVGGSGSRRGRRSQPGKQRRWCRVRCWGWRGVGSHWRRWVGGHCRRRRGCGHRPLRQQEQGVAAADFLGLVRVPKVPKVRAAARRGRSVGGAWRQVLRARQVRHTVRWCRQSASSILNGCTGRGPRRRPGRGGRGVGRRRGRAGNERKRVSECCWRIQGQRRNSC